MNKSEIFSERLKEIMFERKVSVAQLCKMIGKDSAIVYRLLQGKFNPTIVTLLRIADSLNCSIDFLFGRTDEILDFIPQPCPPFYERLRSVMAQKGITRYRIGQDTKIGDDYFTYWKNGGEPQIHSLLQLVEYLDCTIDYLIGREN